MAVCEQCGNDYANAFVITTNGKSHTFDCFECAIASEIANGTASLIRSDRQTRAGRVHKRVLARQALETDE